MEQQVVSPECQKWVLKLMGYDFEIQYRPGMENRAANALSRLHSSVTLMNLIIPWVLQLDQLKKEVDEDETLQEFIKEVLEDPMNRPEFTWVDGQLLYKGKWYLPKGSTLIPLMLKEGHNEQIAGHSGFWGGILS